MTNGANGVERFIKNHFPLQFQKFQFVLLLYEVDKALLTSFKFLVVAFDFHGGFLGRVFQKERNKKTNDVVFLGTQGTFQNGILENILYGAF